MGVVAGGTGNSRFPILSGGLFHGMPFIRKAIYNMFFRQFFFMAGPAKIGCFIDQEKDLIRGMRGMAEGTFPCQGGAVTEFFRLPCGQFIRVSHSESDDLGIGDSVFVFC